MSANAPSQTVFSIGYDFHVGNGTSGADNGNVFGITNYKDNTRNQTFTYDVLNRLVSARNAGTDCTAAVLGGNKKFWGNTYTYDTLAEGDGSGNLTAEYIYFAGKRIARIDLPANTVHYYLSDHLGSTSVVVSAAGAIEEESDYYPFGTEVVVTGPGTNALKFTGKRRDTESQLDYFGARYYSNAFGRFMTPDWAAKATSVPYAEFSDPQSLNLYTYVRNIPTTKVDADGHCPNCVLALGGALVGAAINVGVTYFTKPDATAKDYAGAALSGAITGAVAGFTGGASLGVQVAANVTANVVAGVAERSVESGHVEIGKVSDVAKDGAIGAAGPVLEHLGTKAVQAVAGKTSSEIAERASGSSLGERHSSSLQRQAKSAERAEEAGAKAGTTVARGIEETHRANDNKSDKKVEH